MEQASLNIGTIGQRLEAARQSKGVSVSEAGHATKILSKFIEAMESDDFGALTAPVYAKSFIRMYAKYLGLDDRPLVEEYIKQYAPSNTGPLPEEVKQSLAKAEMGDDDAITVAEPSSLNGDGGGGGTFSTVHGGVMGLSSGLPLKVIFSAVGAILLVGIIVLTATQCAGDEDEAPAPTGGAAVVERQLITDSVPDAYLVKPGVVEVDKD